MVITQENKQQIEEIIQTMHCPRDFECYKSDFQNIGEVGIVGDAEMLECIEPRGRTCEFGSPRGLGTICTCPLRNYVARNFRR
ncbi:MAG: hypothetical protein JSW47_11135 [Phycisphaerales bacterium]|nr:MAG: hypothetical protein JSW47_11135 [Phycisphaerales bacterium]UCF15532.1 MAG: hypothetical protein JSW59_19205 [Phycisphaerales bacterium]